MKILVVAPHPDDEVLGAGGTLLRYKLEGNSIAWLIVTGIFEDFGLSPHKIAERDDEISKISKYFNFDEVHNLKLSTTKLDTLPMENIVQKVSDVIKSFGPDEILIPHLGDIHTDHQVVHNAVLSCTKWFRYPFIKRIVSYETISETDFGLDASRQFFPNVFVDISNFLDDKIKAMEIYSSEMGDFPFPRSKISIESLARYRGSSSGFYAAEAFQLLRERI
jgi:LmbE family N-acetylglucosaminyl deacetylase